MGTNSKIEWTHHSWNPWRGCCHVSPGCDHCYAERQAKRNPKALGQWGKDAPRVIAAEAHWKLPFRWNRAAEEAEISQRVFCASLADVFEDRPDLEEPRRRIFATIDQTPWLDWLLVTKRPHNIRRMWPAIDEATADATILMARAHRAAIAVERSGFSGTTAERHVEFRRRTSNDQYRLNVWLLTTVENQAVATQRIPWLSRCGDLCPVLGLSGEPLLEYVDLTHIDNGGGETYDALRATVTTHRGRTFRTSDTWPINWVIAGGESGHHARPMHPDWARALRDQCMAAGTAFFMKQFGEWQLGGEFRSFTQWVNKGSGWIVGYHKGRVLCMDRLGRPCTIGQDFMRARDEKAFPVSYFVCVGKHAAGRLLDGREWSEIPSAVQAT